MEKIKEKLRIIIFGTDTKAGKWFDIILIYAIFISVLIIVLDSIVIIHQEYERLLLLGEWIFTIIFTLEYLLRIYTSLSSRTYIKSFFGIIDLISIIPAYVSIFLVGSHYLMVIRILRLIRIFRVLKLFHYIGESNHLLKSIISSSRKIIIFLFFVFLLTIIFGSIMYLVEGPMHGFTSIPRGIYWAIVTMTTVGYGDISPQTNLGQFIASIVMILGYSIIAVPTGIISSELSRSENNKSHEQIKVGKFCPQCRTLENDTKAIYCKYCRKKLI